MIDMTPAARERLDDYFQRLRSELRGTRAEVADEVEQGVREHVEIALAEAQAPVGETEILGILDRLGPPEQWLGNEEQAAWQPAPSPARSGAADSRLPWLSFGLVIASIVLIPMFGFLLLIPAMFVSRTWIEQARDGGEPLGARRWLVYPAIALVLALAALVFLIGPPLYVMQLALAGDGRQMFDIPATRAGELRFVAGLRSVVFGSWWIIAAGFCAALVRPLRFVFSPLLDRIRRKHFAALAAAGGLVAAAGAALVHYRH